MTTMRYNFAIINRELPKLEALCTAMRATVTKAVGAEESQLGGEVGGLLARFTGAAKIEFETFCGDLNQRLRVLLRTVEETSATAKKHVAGVAAEEEHFAAMLRHRG